MTKLRGWTLNLPGFATIETETCCNCGVLFGMASDLERQRRRDGKNFFCPNGHPQHYTAEKSAQEKLAAADARATALQDQLDAAVRDAEVVRQSLARDRHRFFNGVCPCCNRSFENVRRHMRGEHPDYDLTAVDGKKLETPFECSCGSRFESYRGLRSHQGQSRRDDWERMAQKNDFWSRRSAHLTVA